MEQRLKSRRQVLFSHALLPTAFQHYNGIISLLKKDKRLRLPVFIEHLEMYFDVLYLHFHPELTFRFLDYEIVHRKWCMDALKMYYPKIIIPEGEKKLVGMYNEFTQNIASKRAEN